jgi:hypothetical protein
MSNGDKNINLGRQLKNNSLTESDRIRSKNGRSIRGDWQKPKDSYKSCKDRDDDKEG